MPDEIPEPVLEALQRILEAAEDDQVISATIAPVVVGEAGGAIDGNPDFVNVRCTSCGRSAQVLRSMLPPGINPDRVAGICPTCAREALE